MSRCSKYCHGLPWQCHLERRAARYSGRPFLHWPLTSVSLARGQKLSPWPGAQISKTYSIFKTTAVPHHTRECNNRFCWHAVIHSEFHPNLSRSIECSSVKDACCDAHTAGRPLSQDLYTRYHANPTNGFFTDVRPRTDRQTDRQTDRLTLLPFRKERYCGPNAAYPGARPRVSGQAPCAKTQELQHYVRNTGAAPPRHLQAYAARHLNSFTFHFER